ncbi:MAG: phosphate ABC transporter permease PstA [Akkermansiaceae bacterium]|nr:phosphate ABC transporter permease PstA [Akkermansiaceae bacterium]
MSKSSNNKGQFASSGRSRKGEPWVWLTAGGLSLGLVMVMALLGLILVKGFAFFWPREVVVMHVEKGAVQGDEEGQGEETQVIAGYIIERSERRGEGGKLVPQIKVFRGNKDLYGQSFIYLDESDIKQQKVPDGYMLLERTAYGPAIVDPVKLVTPTGTIMANEDGFHDAVEEMIELNEEVREEARHIKRKLIGANARKIDDINIKLKVGKIDKQLAEKQIAVLNEEFNKLNAWANKVEARMDGYELHAETADGEKVVYPGETLLRTFLPNDSNLLQRIWEMFCRMGNFIIEEPREANMEGGVFPAIFGTVVMTLAMTLFVTPLGVIAAIYLREYAKQGQMVRVVRICVNNLAGVPSIVFGVFGLAFFVYIVGARIDQLFYADKLPTPTFGSPGILWASLTMALLTLPVVIVATEEALSAVPRGVREAALACGASKWQTIQRIVIPASLPGIMTGIILAMARGAGEVAPLMLVGAISTAPSLPVDDIPPYIHPERNFMHLGLQIYEVGFKAPDAEAARPLVFAMSLLLILLVLVLNLTAIIIRNRLKKKFAVSHF